MFVSNSVLSLFYSIILFIIATTKRHEPIGKTSVLNSVITVSSMVETLLNLNNEFGLYCGFANNVDKAVSKSKASSE